MRSKLSARLALWFLVASLVPLVATAAFALRSMRASLHEEAGQRHAEIGKLSASIVELWMDSTADKLKALAEVMRVDLLERQQRPGDPVNTEQIVSLQNRIAPLIDSNDHWTNPAIPALELEFYSNTDVSQQLSVADSESQQREWEDGGYAPRFNVQNTRWISKNGSPETREQVAQRKAGREASDLVQSPMQTGVFVCEGNIQVIEGTPTLAMSAPVGDVGCNFGSLVAEVDFSELNTLLDRLVSDGVSVRIVDDAGTELCSIGTPAGDLISDSREIGETGWTVTVSEELERIEAPLRPVRQQFALWIGLATLLAVVFSLALSSGITRPVRTLQRAAEAMEGGDLSARSGLVRSDEIGQLATSFDRMATALDHLDAAKSEFVGNVSHELRTPLTSMRLSVANLLDGVVGELDDRQRRTLKRVKRELDRMMRMVSELLDMAKLEAGMVEPGRETVDLAEIADSCARNRRAEAERDGVQIRVSGSGAAFADPAMVRRIFENLLDNALKFSPRGGVVELEISKNSFRVSDQGPGFESESAKMFEKFQQGSVQGVKNDGVGLGLAIVSKLVALNEGTVHIDDGAARGATVRVTLLEVAA